jgi:hypothetical protein
MAGLGALIAVSPILSATLAVGFLAGPHNWSEVRYLLGRLPGRMGKLRPYFLTSIWGTLILGISSLALPFMDTALAGRLWNLGLIAWVTALACLRRNENPRREWPWLEPGALFLAGLMWWSPNAFTLVLIFGHPLLALVILDRELQAFRRPERALFRRLLPAVPVGLLVLLSVLYVSQPSVSWELRSFFVMSGTSPLLLAAHTYLELIHYAVWIGALPLLAGLTRRNALSKLPVLKKSASRLLAAKALLLFGVVVSIVLWCGFYYDFSTTQHLYFRLAIFHVLIEFPFLVRLL